METLKVILHTNGDDKCLQNVVNYPMGKDQVLKEGFGIDINNSKNAAFQFKAVAKFHNNQDKTPVFHYMTSFTNETAPTPEKAMELAILGMLPHNTIGANSAKRLRTYSGSEHPHAAQQPEAIEL